MNQTASLQVGESVLSLSIVNVDSGHTCHAVGLAGTGPMSPSPNAERGSRPMAVAVWPVAARREGPISEGAWARLWLSVALAAILVAGCRSTPSVATPPVSTQAAALAPGTYTSSAFQPAVTFTLPGGWENPADVAGFFQLRPAASESEGIYVFRDPRPASQDASCPETAQSLVGGGSKDMVAWIRSLPGLVVSDPAPVTIGGLAGVTLDLGIVDGWKASCPFANGLPTVPLFVGANGDYRWVIAGAERLRLAVLDAPGGTVVVDVDSFDGQNVDGLLSSADPIVKSFSFAKP